MSNIYRNIHLIYNPVAGKLQRSAGPLIPRVRDVLVANGHGVKLAPTAGPNDAARLAREAVDAGADLVLAAGGDGSINECTNGLVYTDTPMAIIPVGTGNVLGSELGLPQAPEKVAAQIGELTPERLSAGFVQTADEHTRYFLLMAGAGIDAHVVGSIDLELKRKLGKLAYWIGGMEQLGRQFPEFEVAAGGEVFHSCFTLASRVCNYGGDVEIAKTACLLDDHFEMVSFEGKYSFRYLKYFTGVLANRLDKMEGVSIRKVRELEFTPPTGMDVPIQVDGELIGKLPATVKIAPDALTLLIPESFRQRFTDCGQDEAASGVD